MMGQGTKFYRPTLAKLTGTYTFDREFMFAQKSLGKAYRHNAELDVPDFDFAAPGTAHPIMTRRVGLRYLRPEDFDPQYFNMGPFQITYNFSHAVRRNNFPVKNALPIRPKIMKEYGAPGWSFRMLYEFLCEVYNGGEPFVDTYFDRVFKMRPVFSDFTAIYDSIQDSINAEQLALFMDIPLKADGTPDMRYAVSKRFMDFKVWQDPIVRHGCQRLATAIRHDVEVCLRTGQLPLRNREGATISRRAKRLRDELGGMVHPNRLFYASGQLIQHLNIYVEIGDKAA
jgi:hypothetical protein